MVVLDGEESGSVPVTSVVPQGSVLGPILFLIYINDLPDELSSQVRLFADDRAVYLTIGGAEDGKLLQNDLDRLSVWEDRWDMEFNPSKCQVVRVTSSRNPFNFSYTLHGQVLEVVTNPVLPITPLIRMTIVRIRGIIGMTVVRIASAVILSF